MDKSELDAVVEDEELSIPKKARKKIKKYRAAVADALDLEEDEEDEDEDEERKRSLSLSPRRKDKGKKAARAPRESLLSAASEFPKAKGEKLTKTIPFREGSKRYHLSEVMMQEARTDVEHGKVAGKTHKKKKISHSNDYTTMANASMVRAALQHVNARFEVDEEEDTVLLLGFVVEKGSKKGGKKNKKS